ncbi:MAG TPA: hypothetical protein VKA60_14630 [Blastocatellia bacterium]|nr:hypothetical protein [Blastocatellia bacterium]
MVEAALQQESPARVRLARAFTDWFAATALSLGVFLFIGLFLLFAASLHSIDWARRFFQFTEAIHLDLITCLVSPVTGVALAVYRARTNPEARQRYDYRLQAATRYILAYTFLEYGFAKVFKQQFFTNLSTLDVPLGEVSGLELAWRFFGYSYVYTLFIASSQILCSVLLFFRRTTTLAAAMLLPIISNIFIINYTHHIPVRLEALTLLLMVLSLLLADFGRLKAVFWDHAAVAAQPLATARGSRRRRYVKVLLIAFIICFAVGENYRNYLSLTKTATPLYGTWEVQSYQRNGSDLEPSNAAVWRRLYIESDKTLSVKTGQRRPAEIESDVLLDSGPRRFHWQEYYSGDAFLDGRYELTAPDQMLIEGTQGADSIRVTLKKVK